MENLDKNIILLKSAPLEPGVYLLKDDSGTIFYVGKAKSLKKRLSSYFNKKNDGSKSVFLGNRTTSFEVIATENELEALILEDALIKKHRPRFNVRMKDDKSYPYIAMTDDNYPRLIYTRNVHGKKWKTAGPYTDSAAARNVLELAMNVFRLRRCSKKLPLAKNERPCINHQIGKCSGVCTGSVSEDEYKKRVTEAMRFIGGATDSVIKNLKNEMDELSIHMKFEKAAEIRNIIFDIQRISQKQNVSASGTDDTDYICASVKDNSALLLLFEFRSGVLSGRKIFNYENTEYTENEEICERFIYEHYSDSEFLPNRIITEAKLKSSDILQQILSKKRSKLGIFSPRKDEERSVFRIMLKNIDLIRSEKESKKLLSDKTEALEALALSLGIEGQINTIACFDISNFQGKDSVASMSYFRNGYPDKSGYRKFKIRGYDSSNDPGMIHEAVSRYLQGIINESLDFPDMIVIDGGPTQLARALEAASNLKVSVPVVSLAKRNEEIYISPSEPPVVLSKESRSLHIMQNIRDEAHRFGVNYHRQLRSRRIISSPFDSITGIGNSSKEKLLKKYGSAINFIKADSSEIAQLLKISPEKAEDIKQILLSSNVD